jgi:hypothetical protein
LTAYNVYTSLEGVRRERCVCARSSLTSRFRLTVGPAVGQIRDLFTKVKAIDAKHGKFDLCLCVGDFFGPVSEDGELSKDVTELLDGTLEGTGILL